MLDEDATFCPNCGESLETESKSSDYVLVAAVLTIVAAAFCAGLGYIAIYQYNYWVSYYASLGSAVPQELLGFLIFGIPDLIVSAFAIAGAIFMLQRKSLILSILGDILLLVSVFIT